MFKGMFNDPIFGMIAGSLLAVLFCYFVFTMLGDLL